jgi:hypothetical protein
MITVGPLQRSGSETAMLTRERHLSAADTLPYERIELGSVANSWIFALGVVAFAFYGFCAITIL